MWQRRRYVLAYGAVLDGLWVLRYCFQHCNTHYLSLVVVGRCTWPRLQARGGLEFNFYEFSTGNIQSIL